MCVAAQTCESPNKKAAVWGSTLSAMSASKVMDMRARSHATSPVDTNSAPGTLDAHDPHMSPPAWGEKYDSMGSPHSTQAEKSGR